MKSIIRALGIQVLAVFVMLGTLAWRPVMADTNAISNIEFSTLADGKVLIKISTTQKLLSTPVSFTVNAPPRVAMDFFNMSNGLGKNTIPVNQGVLHSMNVVQAGDRTRVVLNLLHPAQYETRVDNGNLMITLSENATMANAATQFSVAGPSTSQHTIRDIDFRRGSSGEGRVITNLSDSTTGIDIHKDGDHLLVHFINTDLPRQLQRRLDVTDFGTPVATITSVKDGQDVDMRITPKGDYEYSAYQTDNQFIVEVRKKAEQAQLNGEKPRYTGEKLSLNFQNTDVRAVLQVIADFTGKNIITSDTVTGNLTLLLKDVPWDQALDIILQSKGLDKRENGNVIWVAPKDELLSKEKSELESRQSIEALEPLVVRQYQLNYKKADAASRELLGMPPLPGDTGQDVTCDAQAQGIKAQTAGAGGMAPTAAGGASNPNRILSARGTATSEMQTNTLIVSDTLTKQEQVAQLLKLIDTPARQVMIEARVVIADSSFQKELGVKFGASAPFSTGNGGTLGGISSSANDAVNTMAAGNTAVSGALGATARATNPFMVDLPSAATNAATMGLSLYNVGSSALLNLELSAMEIDGVGKIISSPRVITSNQKPAVILEGQQIPEVTPGTANAPPTVTFVNAFLCLLVNPQILNNDSVILTIELQDDNEGTPFNSGGVQAIPINTKRVKTQVRVKNGQTVVLGGIYTQTKTQTINKVPGLADLPWLGVLFHDNAQSDVKEELMVFITPHIVKDDMTLQ